MSDNLLKMILSYKQEGKKIAIKNILYLYYLNVSILKDKYLWLCISVSGRILSLRLPCLKKTNKTKNTTTNSNKNNRKMSKKCEQDVNDQKRRDMEKKSTIYKIIIFLISNCNKWESKSCEIHFQTCMSESEKSGCYQPCKQVAEIFSICW